MNRFLALCAFLLTTAAFPAVLYRSDFVHVPDGTKELPGWTLSGGDYGIHDGWLSVNSERSNPLALLPVRHAGDFTFRARVRGAQRVHRAALLYGPYRLEVNNQFVHIGLYRDEADKPGEPLAAAGDYSKYLDRKDVFELRLVRRGDHLLGFADSRKLLDYQLPAPLPGDLPFGLFGGWRTNLDWTEISLSDEPDVHEWPHETLPQPAGRKYVEVVRVRSLADKQPDENLYSDGQEAGFLVDLRLAEPVPPALLCRLRLVDVNGKQVSVSDQPLDTSQPQKCRLRYAIVPPARGCFKVVLEAGPDRDHLGWVEDLGSFAVVSPELERRPRIPSSYFGGHMDAINLGWHLRQARRLGVQWARCHDMMQWTWWPSVQPDGPADWRWADDYQKQVDDLGFGTSGEFLWVPKWAQNPAAPAGANPATYPPADLEAFGRYVYETVSHYKGSIHCWEMWNEPHYAGFFSGSPEQYAAMLKVAYREAKRADPTCQVIGGGGVNMQSNGWIAAMLKAAGGQSMDVFSIHYLTPDLARSDMTWLRAQLDAVGFKGPIWNSEESVVSTSFLDQARTDYPEPEARYHYRNACYELVRTYMENLSNGISRVFYYELADPWRMKAGEKPSASQPSRLGTSLWDEDQMPRPLAAAFAALALAIDGKPFVQRVTAGPLQAFVFGNQKSAVAVQYALYPSYEERHELRLPLPAAVRQSLRLLDFMGNESRPSIQAGAAVVPLSREPLYIQCIGPNAAATLVQAYQQAVFPR